MRIVEQCFEQMPQGSVELNKGQLIEAGLLADLGKRGKTGHIWDARADTDPVIEGSGRTSKPDIAADRPEVVLPSKEETYGSIEGLMRHFELVMWGRGITPPPGEAYFAVEGGNGELGFHVVSDGKDMPYRVRVRPPCFFNMAVLHKMLVGYTVADIVATFGSINMIAGELDR
ncbi:MAG: hypothetical protein HY922_04470 [Elusimicrobia bacterium]|nr:hypothetical protein [Elusimicrobiota bacterium]